MTDINKEGATAPKKRRNKKLAAASIAGIAGLSVIGGGTLAAWNDAETAVAEIDTGNFGIEIRTANSDGTWGDWQDGTTPGSGAELDLTGIIDDVDGHAWRPSDDITTSFQIRATRETTHDGVIAVDTTDVSTDGSSDFSYEIAAVDATYELTGDFAGNSEGGGEVLVPATGEEVDFTAHLALEEGGGEYQGDFSEFLGNT